MKLGGARKGLVNYSWQTSSEGLPGVPRLTTDFRLPFIGLEFDPLTVDEAVQVILQRARELAPLVYVTTPNVDHMVRLARDPWLKPLYDGAWLNLCDSRIIELLAEASYIDLPAAPGSDIVEQLFRDHIQPDEAIVVIGGTQRMADELRRRFGLSDLRWFDAAQGLYGDPDARAQCVSFIRENPAPFVFVAVGSPQQEMVSQEAAASGACTGVAICCGAALEFLTGESKRAPEWMRNRRLEWLHRLALRPTLMWKRYLIDGPRIFLVWQRWRSEPYSPFTPANDVPRLSPPGERDGGSEAASSVLGPGGQRRIPPAA